MTLTKRTLDALTYDILGAVIEVHKCLGPGLLESIYHKCLAKEFSLQKLSYLSEYAVPVTYKGLDIQTNLRCDFLVENAIIIELKAVESLTPIFDAQLFTYMKLLEKLKGILVNFNVENIFKQGQKTLVNEQFRMLPDV